MSFRTVAYVLILTLAPTLVAQDTRSYLDGVVAVIGDETILSSELEAYILMRLNNVKPDKDSANYLELRKQFLDELIDGKVLIAKAKKDTTIEIKSDDVEQMLTQHIASIMSENRLNQEQLEQELKNQGLTLARFKTQLRRGIREQLLKQKIQQSLFTQHEISKKQVSDFYTQYKDSLPTYGKSVRLSRLMIQAMPGDSIRQLAWDKISKIKQRLVNGEDFQTLAKQFSEDGSAENGGDLGFISKGTLSELAFEEHAFSLKVGEISDPFETRLGFHILQVTERKDQQVHVFQIFVKIAPSAERVKTILAQLDSIKTACHAAPCFAEAARTLSSDPVLRARGGDIGWMPVENVPSAWRSGIDTLVQGAMSSVVNDESGYSLFFVTATAESRALSLEDDYPVLAEKAKEIDAQKRMYDKVHSWRKEVFIDVRL